MENDYTFFSFKRTFEEITINLAKGAIAKIQDYYNTTQGNCDNMINEEIQELTSTVNNKLTNKIKECPKLLSKSIDFKMTCFANAFRIIKKEDNKDKVCISGQMLLNYQSDGIINVKLTSKDFTLIVNVFCLRVFN